MTEDKGTPMPTKIAVIGTNYVGLVTAACLAQLGHSVIGIDVDAVKVAQLRRGYLPMYEPDLDEIVHEQVARGRLQFTLDYATGLHGATCAFICVGTPPHPDGSTDLSQVSAAVESLAQHTPAHTHLVVVNKSTLPVGTGDWMEHQLRARALHSGVRFSVVSNPEFLREGSAVRDFRGPDRIVVGGDDPEAIEHVAQLYRNLSSRPPMVRSDRRTAELVKYASNAFLATRISFINEMALLCEAIDADVETVALGMGLDSRIGPSWLEAGIGYGGSCFPKDIQSLAHQAKRAGVRPRILRAVTETNQQMRRLVIDKLVSELGDLRGRTIGVLGLAFKPNTDDVRESPALDIARTLHAMGARVCGYDPAAMRSVKRQLPELERCADAESVATDADALLLLTEWDEFRDLDLESIRDRMREPVVIDGRNVFDPELLESLGFRYRGIGRGRRSADAVEAKRSLAA
jgi:UDPglucose 6-dehydrogenase